MKDKFIIAVAGAALLLGGLTGCASAKVSGTVMEMEYEGRNCEQRSGTKCKRWDPAEYELTIRKDSGAEVELVVDKATYERTNVGDTGTWEGSID